MQGPKWQRERKMAIEQETIGTYPKPGGEYPPKTSKTITVRNEVTRLHFLWVVESSR